MTKHPTLKHLIAIVIGFSVAYLVGLLFEGVFGWHAYAAGAIANLLAHLFIHYFVS